MRRFVKPGEMIKWRRRDVAVPFPWLLGGPMPQLGPNQFYLTDDKGAYLQDDEGNYLIGERGDFNGY